MVSNRILIGLTGGIGSGKTAVADLFAEYGITIIDADLITRELVMPGTAALQAIVKHFGESILDNAGTLNRRALRDRIFNNPSERLWLEQLLHPQVMEKIKKQAEKSQSAYCIAVVPLLLETKSHLDVDRILVVDAPVELQYQRIRERDNMTDPMIDAILKTQCSREQRVAAAHDVIVNDQDFSKLKQQVKKLHEYYSKYNPMTSGI